MLTVQSKINKQIAKNLELEGLKVPKKKQQMIIDLINSKKNITNKDIREIAFK